MYESFFGLTGLPFQLNPDPTFLFHGKGHRDAFAALQKGLAEGGRVMVLTGEVGAGKTTLLQALLATVDSATTVTAHISASGLDAEMLTDRLCESLGEPPLPDPLARRDALLTRLRSGPLTTLLVIDEAQHLEASAFELLETMADAGGTRPARLQICLVGQPELRILLNAADRSRFRELVNVDRHLRPLEQSEIRLYIEHRLHRAGWTGRPEFADAAFFEIFVFTAGIPRRVNLLCNSLLLSAWLKKQEWIDAPAVTRAAAALRGDSVQGEPDLLEAESDFARAPTLTEPLAPDPPAPDDRVSSDGSHPWSCPNCSSFNAATAIQCWKCETARASSDDAAWFPRDALHHSHTETAAEAVSTSADAIDGDGTTSAPRLDDLPPLTMSDGAPQADDPVQGELINARLARLVREEESATRRRRQAIFASVASVAVAAAAIAYVMDRQSFNTSLSKIELPNVGLKRTAVPSLAGPALDAAAPSGSPVAAAASSPELANSSAPGDIGRAKEAQDDAASPAHRRDDAPHATGTSSALLDANPPGSGSRTVTSCSEAASALGLCDAETSSSTRR